MVTVFVPASRAPNVHVLFVYTVYVTDPPAFPVALDRVDESLTEPPTVIELEESDVAIEGEAFPTTRCSSVQVLVAPLLLASPVYTACQ